MISCFAMSSHCVMLVLSANFFMNTSVSQLRLAVRAYAPAGDASVTLVVVTIPVAFPAH